VTTNVTDRVYAKVIKNEQWDYTKLNSTYRMHLALLHAPYTIHGMVLRHRDNFMLLVSYIKNAESKLNKMVNTILAFCVGSQQYFILIQLFKS
jgi:hypothetical protein